ncbi:hypothetical protein [Poritiphilus flavus]|uniref:SpoIIAA-like n=1 Tax=Poritiphilus flavus TaxID=2697053 RepID=A0A6L9ED22_9FLAO|nr:hypothetical protein [Poritiphilus flavus]NAS12513.1 hypothetical protein [Poritiphilus flavus]
MKPRSVRDTVFYGRALNELNYPFGDFFLFDSFIIAEIHEDVLFNWEEHGKRITEDLSNLYENDGRDIVYISNRIHSYNVMPADWIKFFRNSYKLRGYAIVSYSRASYLNALLEKLFVPTRFRRFRSLDWAISWATELSRASVVKV